MQHLAAALRAEIGRAVAREQKRARRSARRLRGELTKLRRSVTRRDHKLRTLQRRVERLRAQAGRVLRDAAKAGRARAVGFSADAVRGLRRRLRLSRKKFAALLEVSPGSIFGWETGRTIPRGRNVKRLRTARGWSAASALRKLGFGGARPVRRKQRRRATRA